MLASYLLERSRHLIAMPEQNTGYLKAHTTAFVRSDTHGERIGGPVLGKLLHMCAKWVPLDGEDNVSLESRGRHTYVTHGPRLIKTRVDTILQTVFGIFIATLSNQPSRQRQHPLAVVIGLIGRMLGAWVQIQSKIQAPGSQIGCYSLCIHASPILLGGTAVVDIEGLHNQGHTDIGLCTNAHGYPAESHVRKELANLIGKVKHIDCMRTCRRWRSAGDLDTFKPKARAENANTRCSTISLMSVLPRHSRPG